MQCLNADVSVHHLAVCRNWSLYQYMDFEDVELKVNGLEI